VTQDIRIHTEPRSILVTIKRELYEYANAREPSKPPHQVPRQCALPFIAPLAQIIRHRRPEHNPSHVWNEGLRRHKKLPEVVLRVEYARTRLEQYLRCLDPELLAKEGTGECTCADAADPDAHLPIVMMVPAGVHVVTDRTGAWPAQLV
jgi:hypothetical protein